MFLDWERACDKVDQIVVVDALNKLNLADTVIDIIKRFHNNPQFCKFRIKDGQGESDYREPDAGIRQGCILS